MSGRFTGSENHLKIPATGQTLRNLGGGATALNKLVNLFHKRGLNFDAAE